jgi:hypothetical protein
MRLVKSVESFDERVGFDVDHAALSVSFTKHAETTFELLSDLTTAVYKEFCAPERLMLTSRGGQTYLADVTVQPSRHSQAPASLFLIEPAIGVEARSGLRQCMVRNFTGGRKCGLELRLFRFEFVDPMFQIGYGMIGFFHRAIFCVHSQRCGNRPGKIENPCHEESGKQRPHDNQIQGNILPDIFIEADRDGANVLHSKVSDRGPGNNCDK